VEGVTATQLTRKLFPGDDAVLVSILLIHEPVRQFLALLSLPHSRTSTRAHQTVSVHLFPLPRGC
jgi:hypothetical protein